MIAPTVGPDQRVPIRCNCSAVGNPNGFSSVTIPTVTGVGRSLSERYNRTTLSVDLYLRDWDDLTAGTLITHRRFRFEWSAAVLTGVFRRIGISLLCIVCHDSIIINYI